jgi:hypothetical protein
VVAAGLERHVERRVTQVGVAAGRQRVDLGVGAADVLVPTLAQDLVVAGHDRTDHRVRARPPRPAPGQLDGAGEVDVIGLGALHMAYAEDRPAHRPPRRRQTCMTGPGRS